MGGHLVQLDGSSHNWFEVRAPWRPVFVLIDAATSRILWLQFATGESTLEVMHATQASVGYYTGFTLSMVVYLVLT